MKKLLFLSLFLFSQIVLSESSKSDKDLYELQEKCGKTTENEFKKEWGNGIVNTKDGQTTANYQSHYNKKMNKCFYLLNTTIYPKKKDLIGIMESKSIWDILENKNYGLIDSNKDGILSCQVNENRCHSKNEWESLTKSYMND